MQNSKLWVDDPGALTCIVQSNLLMQPGPPLPLLYKVHEGHNSEGSDSRFLVK